MKDEIKDVVYRTIESVAAESELPLDELKLHMQISDEIGLTSLQLAEVVALLDNALQVSPFEGMAAITDIVTLADLVAVYRKARDLQV